MKKIILLFALLSTLLVGCKKEDDTKQSSLAGTKWTQTYVDDLMVLEFTSDNGVALYWADKNLNIDGRAYTGTYSLKGNIISFKLSGWHYAKYVIDNATINGGFMTVNSRWSYKESDVDNGGGVESTDTYIKK